MEGPLSNRFFLTAWVAINLLRLLVLFQMGPMPQDAYYHLYSQQLDWSYYDHPPFIAYLLRIFSEIFGSNTWSIKLADFSVTALTQVAFYWLARALLSHSVARLSTLLFSTTLMVSILSVVSTPDVPLILFWIVSMMFLYRAIFRGQSGMWILAGLSMGFAFNSKYPALLLPIGLLGFLALSEKYRYFLKTRWPYLSILVMILAMSPVIWWNVVHNFASFKFHVEERSGDMTGHFIRPDFILGLLGHQSILLLPPLFIAVCLALKRQSHSLLKHQIRDKSLFLLCFSVPIIGGFLLISPFLWIKINWLMPGYVAGILLAAPLLSHRWLRWQGVFVVTFHLAFAIQVIWYPVPVKSDDTWYGWDQLVTQWRALKKVYPGTFTFSSDGYKTTAVLQFLSKEKIYGRNIIGQPGLQFDFIGDDLTELKGRDAIYLNSQNQFGDLLKSGVVYPQIKPYFRYVVVLNPIVIFRNKIPVRKFQVFLCRDYLGP